MTQPLRIPPRTLLLAAAALVVAAAIAPLAYADSLQSIIQNFKATIQRHPNGRVKTQMTAGSAIVKQNNDIEASDVRLFMLNDQGQIESILESDSVHVDIKSQTGLCPNKASFERHSPRGRDSSSSNKPTSVDGVRLEGSHVEWLGRDSQIIIHSNAVITLYRDGRSIAEGWNTPQ